MNYFYKGKNLLKLLVIISALALTYQVLASSNGITGRSTSGCGGGSCHGGSSNSATTVSPSVEGDSWAFSPGETKTITITVSNSSQWGAGFNAAIKTSSGGGGNYAGTLTAGSNTRLQNNEVTHNGKQQFTNSSVGFEFEWTAPNTPGTYYLTAAGNAVNNSGNTGDVWNIMDEQEITVKGLDLTSLTGGDEFCTGSSVDITWDNTGITNVKIELSSNGGNSYDDIIVASTPAANESYTWDIPNTLQSGNTYRIRISDASDAEINDVSGTNFTISEGHIITVHPLPQVQVCTNDELSLSVEAVGVGLTYQWQLDGNDIANANQATYSKQNPTDSDEGNYTCVVSSDCGGEITSEASDVTILEGPKVTSFPTARAVCENGTVEIIAEATGNNLTYKWYKDDVLLGGETNPILTISNAQASNAGDYVIEVISDNCGSVRSQECVLTIRQTPVITSDIQNTDVCAGEEVVFWIAAEGNAVEYQWYQDNQAISGANTATYTIESFEAIHEGTYFCQAFNTCGPVDSQEQEVIYTPAHIITSQPEDLEIEVGSEIRLSVSTNTDPVSYEWYHNGNPLVDSNIPELVIGNATEAMSGEYYCLINTTCVELTSNTATVTVTDSFTGPKISLSTTSVNLGKTQIGESSELVVKEAIRNIGNETLVLESILVNDPAFGVEESATIGIEPDQALDLNLSFTPVAEEVYEGILTIQTNAGEIIIDLFGEGVQEALVEVEANVSLVEFDEVTEAGGDSSFEIVITNVDTEDATLTDITVTNNSDVFILGDGGTIETPESIATQEQYSFEIIFAPSESGTFTDQLVIGFSNSNDIEISLSGIADIVNSVKEAASSLMAYPNPSSSNINMSISLVEPGTYSYKIFDVNGNVVADLGTRLSLSKTEQIEWNGLDKNGNSPSDGMYFIMIEGDNNVSTLNIIIQK